MRRKITSRVNSNGLRKSAGSIGEHEPGMPVSAHIGGLALMVIVRPRSLHAPTSVPFWIKCDSGSANPEVPAGKISGARACPVTEVMEFRAAYGDGTLMGRSVVLRQAR